MKNIHSRFLAYALVIVMAAVFIFPATGSEEEKTELQTTESGASEEQTESEDFAESLEDTSQAISKVISKGYDLSLDLKLEEPMQNYLSDILKGVDMSWADEATFTGASAGNEDGGVDLSGTLALNGTDLYDGRASFDADDQRLYLLCTQFRKTPFVLDLKKGAAEAGRAAEDALSSSGKGKGSEDKKDDSERSGSGDDSGIFRADFGRLASEGAEFFSSLKEEEIEEFLAHCKEAAENHYQISAHENVTVTAGALSGQVATRTITVTQDDMLNILSAGRETLKEEPLIRKALTSDFGVDVANTIAAGAKVGTLFSGDSLWNSYQDLLAAADDSLLGRIPGFSVTYGLDSRGRLAVVGAQILYTGASVDLFTLSMLTRDTHASVQFDLGGLVSAYLASEFGGSSSGETGMVIDADIAGGRIRDKITVVAAGEELGSLSMEDFTLEDLEKGVLNGTMTLTIRDMEFQAGFMSAGPGEIGITGRFNGEDYLTISASAKATDKAKVEKIRRKKAMEVYDQATWDEYIKDARLTSMILKLGKGGVPDSIIEMLTSGEAVTEKSKENTVENDGTGELKNGEVGGADIGNN